MINLPQARFLDSVVRMYPQLKKSQTDLEFGYKVPGRYYIYINIIII